MRNRKKFGYTPYRSDAEMTLQFDIRWGDLSRYNAEVARGIMHTPEYKLKMEYKQALYNQYITDADPYYTWTCPIP